MRRLTRSSCSSALDVKDDTTQCHVGKLTCAITKQHRYGYLGHHVFNYPSITAENDKFLCKHENNKIAVYVDIVRVTIDLLSHVNSSPKCFIPFNQENALDID